MRQRSRETGNEAVGPIARAVLRRARTSLLPRLRIPRWVAAILVGLAGAWIGMLAGGSMTVRTGPFDVLLSANVGPSVTEIALPPLGSLSADTHIPPPRLFATFLGGGSRGFFCFFW